MNYGENLARCRKKMQLSQEQFAQKIYVSRQTVSSWERNKSSPSLEALHMMYMKFGITMEDLFCEQVKRKEQQT